MQRSSAISAERESLSKRLLSTAQRATSKTPETVENSTPLSVPSRDPWELTMPERILIVVEDYHKVRLQSWAELSGHGTRHLDSCLRSPNYRVHCSPIMSSRQQEKH